MWHGRILDEARCAEDKRDFNQLVILEQDTREVINCMTRELVWLMDQKEQHPQVIEQLENEIEVYKTILNQVKDSKIRVSGLINGFKGSF